MTTTSIRPVLSPSVNNTMGTFSIRVSAWAVVLSLGFAWVARAEVYSYECDSLPAAADWELVQAFCDPQEWVDDGDLVQQVLMCDDFPGEGQQFDYTRDIEDLEGLTSWFIEWRVITTGISEELPWTAPAALVAYDGNGHVYHFTIADDQVRFIRDFDFPTPLIDITPGIPHTFRVEIFGVDLGETYVVYIDGEIVDSGEAESPFHNPLWQPGVNFRAKAKFVPSMSTWSHIRWGERPINASGDFDSSGVVDADDQYFFQECLTTGAGGWAGCVWADMDGSGGVDCTDWELFLKAWTDPDDQPCSLTCGDCQPADFNHDGVVGPFDLATLLAAWGPCGDCDDCAPDLNEDCQVGPADLAMLLGSWG